MKEPQTNLTVMLERAAAGDAAANDDLFQHVYPTLKKLAHSQLSRHQRGTLCTTELVHEVSLKLFGAEHLGNVENRSHLMATAARAMRHILVDHARKRGSKKRGGEWARIELDASELSADRLSEQVLALEGALKHLHDVDERCHQVVELKFFGGFTIPEIAEFLDVSEGTVKLAWRKARAFLYAEIDST